MTADSRLPDADPRRRADVLLLTGLHEEMHWVHRTTGVDFETIPRQGTRYLRGEIHHGDRSVSLVTLRQLDKGLTLAGVTATKAICLWEPRLVIMTGICAGIRGAVDLGDLIIATQSFEHSTGQRIEGEIQPAQNRIPIKPWLLDFLMSLTETGDLAAEIQKGFTQPLPENTRTRIHYGSMACGPYVVKDSAYMETLRSRESSLLGLDMESYGVVLAAEMCSSSLRPVVPLVVKGVCDFADSSKGDDWHDYCGYASASLAMALLRQVMSGDNAFAQLKGTSAS